MSRRKKLITAAVLILLVTGLIYYLFYGRGSSPAGGGLGNFFGGELPNTGNENGGGTAPGNGFGSTPIPVGGSLPATEEEQKRLVQISKDPVTGVAVSSEKNTIRYFKLGQGFIYSSSFDGMGGEQSVSNTTFKDIASATWSRDKKYALVVTAPENTIPEYTWVRLVGTSTIESGTVPGVILSAAFAPVGNSLASIVNANGSYVVRTGEPDGTKIKTVGSVSLPDFEVLWPKKDELLLKTKTSGLAPSVIEHISTATNKILSVEGDDYGYDVMWNSSGTKYLDMKTDPRGQNIQLSLHIVASTTVSELSFRTFPEKCIFSDKDPDTIYCAIPRKLPERDALPDVWWQGQFHPEDMVWKINTKSGETALVLEGGGFDITHPLLSPNEDYIFFINKNDSTLWSLRLL